MENFNEFFKSILRNSGLSLLRDLNIPEIRQIISKINEYFYTNYEGIGYTYELNDYYEYFSEFHKFWEKYHKEIINPRIDEISCEKIANVLHNLYQEYGKKLFYELYETYSLQPEDICRIRYFSANQDFRGTRSFKDLFKKYIDDPSIFDTFNINNNPEDFPKNIKLTSLSQSDKRVKYASVASQILIEKNITPYELLSYTNNDILKLRNFLISNTGSGFGSKKTDMFLRDMVVLGVWKNPINFDKIDVSSDINTIKVALRTGILKTEIPLISSFMDIFCYQYGVIDEMNALAWRKVWSIWNDKFPDECIESPCLIDNLIYRIIGKEFCKESLCTFECVSKKHMFKWHSSRNKTCQTCYKNNIRNKAHVIKKVLPCTDSDGFIVIEKNKYTSSSSPLLPGLKECPFVPVCNPKNNNFKKLNPPKSISILGQTGWESAKTRREEGGGGLMS
ncbi:MAG: hypothetical protein HQ591_02635 [candidate division Zixibacteria bacterium]|nr:hypothetical protein [Candidatus Tariuqbacter arcticus]